MACHAKRVQSLDQGCTQQGTLSSQCHIGSDSSPDYVYSLACLKLLIVWLLLDPCTAGDKTRTLAIAITVPIGAVLLLCGLLLLLLCLKQRQRKQQHICKQASEEPIVQSCGKDSPALPSDIENDTAPADAGPYKAGWHQVRHTLVIRRCCIAMRLRCCGICCQEPAGAAVSSTCDPDALMT